jgi:hypothetical protein
MIYRRLEPDEIGWLIEGLNVLRDRWSAIFLQPVSEAEGRTLV